MPPSRRRMPCATRLPAPPTLAPADVMPPGLERLTKLECLWIVTQTPLQLPTSLAANLQGLHVIGRGFHEEQRQLLRWDWLGPFKLLRGMRLQVEPSRGALDCQGTLWVGSRLLRWGVAQVTHTGTGWLAGCPLLIAACAGRGA